MSPTYEDLLKDQTSVPHRGKISAEILFVATFVATSVYQGIQLPDSTETEINIRADAAAIYHQENQRFLIPVLAADAAACHSESERIMQRVQGLVDNQDLRDEAEPAPPQTVINEFERLVLQAANWMKAAMPPGQVSVFFGELNITWRSGDKIVRLACFPSRPSLVQTGSLSMPVGSYRSELNPTAELLAERLDALISENNPEGLPFLG